MDKKLKNVNLTLILNISMLEPKKCSYLLDFFISKRRGVNGYETPFVFYSAELAGGRMPMSISEVEEYLGILETDTVVTEKGVEHVIISHAADEDGKITVIGSSIEKFLQYQRKVKGKISPEESTIAGKKVKFDSNGNISIGSRILANIKDGTKQFAFCKEAFKSAYEKDAIIEMAVLSAAIGGIDNDPSDDDEDSEKTVRTTMNKVNRKIKAGGLIKENLFSFRNVDGVKKLFKS